jgi:hypothetical protein
MTDARQFSDDEGDFSGYYLAKRPCRFCGSGNVLYRIWESHDGAYEDYRYECQQPNCGKRWWVDGIDS